jgi:primosomal protein N' (replication factor Y)
MDKVEAFLYTAKQQALACQVTAVELWGPANAQMERRNGHYRMQLLLQAAQRKMLHHLLKYWLPTLTNRDGVHWSLDIDPQDLL